MECEKVVYLIYQLTTNTNTMKKLKEFTIHIKTQFGLGQFKLKASSFEDAYNRLSPKYKKTLIIIYDENHESFSA